MKPGGAEQQLRAEIRQLTSKLRAIRDELREEIRHSTAPRIVAHADERPLPRSANRRRRG